MDVSLDMWKIPLKFHYTVIHCISNEILQWPLEQYINENPESKHRHNKIKTLKNVVIFHTFYVSFITHVAEDLIILLRPIKALRSVSFLRYNTNRAQYCKIQQNEKHKVASKGMVLDENVNLESELAVWDIRIELKVVARNTK